MSFELAGSSLQSGAPDSKPSPAAKERPWVKIVLIAVAIAYLSLILFIPAINVFAQAFKSGVGPFLKNLGEPAFTHAAWLTTIIALIVVPINTVFRGTTIRAIKTVSFAAWIKAGSVRL